MRMSDRHSNATMLSTEHKVKNVPFFPMRALTDDEMQVPNALIETLEEDMENCQVMGHFNIVVHRPEPEPVHPGAVAVAGFVENNVDDGTVVIGEEVRSNSMETYNSRHPITAHIVEDDEEERRVLEQQLREQERELRQLQRVLAERENVTAAQIISAEDEAQESDNEDNPDHRFSTMKNKPPIYLNRRFQLYSLAGAIILIAIIVGVIIGIVTREDQALQEPTAAPTILSEPMYRQQFVSAVGEQVNEAGSPYDRAAKWIMFEDPRRLQPDADNLIQRYQLVLFYFLTTNNGRTRWKSCNPPLENEMTLVSFKTCTLLVMSWTLKSIVTKMNHTTKTNQTMCTEAA